MVPPEEKLQFCLRACLVHVISFAPSNCANLLFASRRCVFARAPKKRFFRDLYPSDTIESEQFGYFLSLSTIGTRIIGVPPGFFAHFPTAFFGVLRALLRTSRLPCGELCCAPRRPDAFFVFFWCPRWSAPSNYETAKTWKKCFKNVFFRAICKAYCPPSIPAGLRRAGARLL